MFLETPLLQLFLNSSLYALQKGYKLHSLMQHCSQRCQQGVLRDVFITSVPGCQHLGGASGSYFLSPLISNYLGTLNQTKVPLHVAPGHPGGFHPPVHQHVDTLDLGHAYGSKGVSKPPPPPYPVIG